MWAPGAYLPDRGEGDAVHANIGVEKYFFAAGDRILNRIKEVRNTVILPERTGPIADVLYSAAGNSADEHWYNRGVIAYSFETGADRFGADRADAAGRGRRDRRPGRGPHLVGRRATRSSIGYGTPTEERRIVASVINPNPQNPAPNITLTAAAGAGARGGRAGAGADDAGRRRLPAAVRDRGQVRGARVRRGQLRAAGVGVRSTRRTTSRRRCG